MKLTPYLYLLSRLRMYGGIQPRPHMHSWSGIQENFIILKNEPALSWKISKSCHLLFLHVNYQNTNCIQVKGCKNQRHKTLYVWQ